MPYLKPFKFRVMMPKTPKNIQFVSFINFIFNKQITLSLLFLTIFFISPNTYAQKEDENIGTEVVNVVKPYSPTISDAYKVKETPTLDDNVTNAKEIIEYKIFSFPVASTFTPSKGRAAGVENAKKERIFSNYASLGLGNYGTANAELFVGHKIDNYQTIGGKMQHQSSQGGIKGTQLEDKFAETKAAVLYAYNKEKISFKADLGYKNERYNWYGLPLKNPNYNLSRLDTINPKHVYNNFSLDSEFALKESFFEKVTFRFIGFTDNYQSKENRFIINPYFKFDFGDHTIKTKFNLDYLNSKLDTFYPMQYPLNGSITAIEKSILMFSANPSYRYLKDDLSIDIGAEVTFFSFMKNVFAGIESESKNDILIYPKVRASYQLVDEIMVAYAGLEGGLLQNSYQNFVLENKFLSPTLNINPTDNQYTASLGLKGKLSNTVTYNINAAYASLKNMPLFKSNAYLSKPSQNYSFGNSFKVVYDNVKRVSFFGELKADINKDVTLGLHTELNSYHTEYEKEAWNLPALKVTFTSDFNIGKKWYAGIQFFYVGERKDEFTNFSSFTFPDSVQTIGSFFDINAHIGYQFNERFAFFLKGNNLANQNYNRWLNYPVQGAQVIVGANYKFDF